MPSILMDTSRDGIVVITINRPQRRNALDGDAWRRLGDAFVAASARPGTRAIILTGAGGHFCSGDDIVAFSKVRDDPAARSVYWNSIMDCYTAVSASSVPVIAAVRGACVGGGCTLALRSDFRLADTSARFGIPPAKLGLVYPAESTRLLVAAVGITMAKRLLYTGEIIGAEEARIGGLTTAMVEGDVVEAAIAFARPIVTNAPISLAATKLICDAIAMDRVEAEKDRFEALFRDADASEDAREGARAFAEKRAPKFKGR